MGVENKNYSAENLHIITPKVLRIIYDSTFIRHGQTFMNEEGLIQGSTDDSRTFLTKKGRSQARKSAQQILRTQHSDFLLMVSPMQRTRQTAQIIKNTLIANARATEIITHNPNFQEYNFGDWEGISISTLCSDPDYKSMHEHIWKPNPVSAAQHNVPPNAENFYSFLKRVNRGLHDIAAIKYSKNAHIVVVTHAMVLRAIRFLYRLANVHNIFDLTNAQKHGGEFFFDQNDFIKPPNGFISTHFFIQ